MAKTKWWALQDVGDSKPWGLAALVDGDNLPRRFVPGEGLVDWPSLAGEVFQGESGAHRIGADEARTLMARLPRVNPDVVADMRGKARTIPATM